MPRKSKSLLEAEAKIREEEKLADVRTNYGKKFFPILEKASNYNFYFEVKNGLFEVSIFDEDWDELRRFFFALPNSEVFLKDSYEFVNQMGGLEELIERIEIKHAEEMRLKALKKLALSKLSDEEKSALNLV